MERRIARQRGRHQKGPSDLPFNISPQMYKTVEKYMWVFVVILGIVGVIAYMQVHPYVMRAYRHFSGQNVTVEAERAPLDFFTLSMQWPGSACRFSNRGACADGGRRLAEVGFTLQGFRPGLTDAPQPTQCAAAKGETLPKFKLEDLSPVLPSLHHLWPSLGKFSDKTVYQQEWERYGTCAVSKFPKPLDYFKAALDLRSKIHIADTLNAAGLVPSEDITYSAEQITSAVRDAYGAEPVLKCQSDGHGGYQLDQVWLCVDKDNLAVTSFPAEWKRPTSTCGDGAHIRIRPLLVRAHATRATEPAADVEPTADETWDASLNADDSETMTGSAIAD